MNALVFVVMVVAGALLTGPRAKACRGCGRTQRRCQCRSNRFKHLLN